MYDYQTERPKLFTEDGHNLLRDVERNARRCIELAGCVRQQELVASITGDTWLQLAACDYLIETGVLREIDQASRPPGQYRIFAAGGSY